MAGCQRRLGTDPGVQGKRGWQCWEPAVLRKRPFRGHQVLGTATAFHQQLQQQ